MGIAAQCAFTMVVVGEVKTWCVINGERFHSILQKESVRERCEKRNDSGNGKTDFKKIQQREPPNTCAGSGTA